MLDRTLGTSRRRVVSTERSVELLQSVRKKVDQRLRHLLMQESTLLAEQRAVRYFLNDNVLEDVLQLGDAGALAHQIGLLQM